MIKINLGAGNDILEGYINHDIRQHRPEIKLVFDLDSENWWQDIVTTYGFVDELRAWDVIEHLCDTINFMNNAWDTLKPGGTLDMKACGWQNPNFNVDITHKNHGFDIRSFDYFDPDTELGQIYGYYTDKKWKIISKDYDRRKNILVKMMPRK